MEVGEKVGHLQIVYVTTVVQNTISYVISWGVVFPWPPINRIEESTFVIKEIGEEIEKPLPDPIQGRSVMFIGDTSHSIGNIS